MRNSISDNKRSFQKHITVTLLLLLLLLYSVTVLCYCILYSVVQKSKSTIIYLKFFHTMKVCALKNISTLELADN